MVGISSQGDNGLKAGIIITRGRVALERLEVTIMRVVGGYYGKERGSRVNKQTEYSIDKRGTMEKGTVVVDDNGEW